MHPFDRAAPKRKNFYLGKVLTSVIFLLACGLTVMPVSAEMPGTQNDSAINSQEARRLFASGKKFHLAQKFQEAIKEYEKALVHDPEFSKAQQALAWAKRDLQRQQISQPENQSADGKTKEAQAHLQRGNWHENNNRPLEAAEAYKDALRILPDYQEAKEALKRVQAQGQRTLVPGPYTALSNQTSKAPENFPEAKTEKDRSFSKKGKPPVAGNLAEINERTKEVKPQLYTNVKVQTSSPDPNSQTSIRSAIQKHFLAGSQAMDRGDYALAVREFELILEFMPEHREAQFKLNLAEKKQAQEVKNAKQKVERAKNQGDKMGELSALRDVMNIDPNDREAMEAWEKTKVENKGIIEEIYRKGVTAYAQGNYNAALQAWELVLDLDPNHTKAQESISKVRQKMELIK